MKTWRTKKGAQIPVDRLESQHLINILRIEQKKAEMKRLAVLQIDEDDTSTWRQYVPDIFMDLELEAAKRKIDWDLVKDGAFKFDDEIDLSAIGTLERKIAGALKSVIQTHGPITVEKLPSAVKRVLGAIRDHNHRIRSKHVGQG